MIKYRIVILFLSAAFLVCQIQLAAAESIAKINPNLKPRGMQKPQPFSGELKFQGSVSLGQPVSVSVKLSSLRDLDGSCRFRLSRNEPSPTKITPDSIVWKEPIDSGGSFSLMFSVVIDQVGTHRFTLESRERKTWRALGTLLAAISEEGKVIFAGADTDYHGTMVDPHPGRRQSPLVVEFPRIHNEFSYATDRHFTASFHFDHPPGLNETTFVDFELDCFFDLYSKVQFVLEQSSTLNVSELPESWGDKVGPIPEYRHYKGRFWFVPNRTGVSYMSFKIIGKRPMIKQSDRITTEFPIYFVLGDDGKLLFIGDFDPWMKFKDKNDPMLGDVAVLLDVEKKDFRTKYILSKPDFQGDENKLPDEVDSAGQK